MRLLVSGGTEPYTYKFNDENIDTNVVENLAAGTYIFTINDARDCGPINSNIFTINNPDSIYISSIETEPEVFNSDGNLLGSISVESDGGTGIHTYILEKIESTDIFNDYETIATNSVEFTNLTHGIYEINVIDENDCDSEADISINYIDERIIIYDAFTPNNDGSNDIWNIKYIDNYPDNTVQIFNSWGNMVFESKGYAEPWNGTSNGNQLPRGTYYFVIDLGNDLIYKGTVTLIR